MNKNKSHELKVPILSAPIRILVMNIATSISNKESMRNAPEMVANPKPMIQRTIIPQRIVRALCARGLLRVSSNPDVIDSDLPPI